MGDIVPSRSVTVRSRWLEPGHYDIAQGVDPVRRIGGLDHIPDSLGEVLGIAAAAQPNADRFHIHANALGLIVELPDDPQRGIGQDVSVDGEPHLPAAGNQLAKEPLSPRWRRREKRDKERAGCSLSRIKLSVPDERARLIFWNHIVQGRNERIA
jgi:hypothetical protein